MCFVWRCQSTRLYQKSLTCIVHICIFVMQQCLGKITNILSIALYLNLLLRLILPIQITMDFTLQLIWLWFQRRRFSYDVVNVNNTCIAIAPELAHEQETTTGASCETPNKPTIYVPASVKVQRVAFNLIGIFWFEVSFTNIDNVASLLTSVDCPRKH